MTPQDRQDLIETLREVMASQTGSTADLIRAVMGATTDGLIDAWKAMHAAGMPDYLIAQAFDTILGNGRKIAGAGAAQAAHVASHTNHGETE